MTNGAARTHEGRDADHGYVAAVAVIVVRGDRLLAMRRSARKDAGPGMWETLSGRIEPGEEPLAAAAREVQEETALTVELEPRPVTAYRAERLGHPMIVIVYRADWLAGEVAMSDEHDRFEWLTPDEFARRSRLAKLIEAVRTAMPTSAPPGKLGE